MRAARCLVAPGSDRHGGPHITRRLERRRRRSSRARSSSPARPRQTRHRADERGQRTVTGPADLGSHAVGSDGRRCWPCRRRRRQRPHVALSAPKAAIRGQIPSANASHIFLGRDSPPSPAVPSAIFWITWELTSRRGRERPWSVFMIGHAALPDCELTRSPSRRCARHRAGRRYGHLPHVVDVTVGGIRIQLHRVYRPLLMASWWLPRTRCTPGRRHSDVRTALVAVLHRAPDPVNIGEVDLRVHTGRTG